MQYQNTEQYMMAQKAKLFADEKIFQKILQTENPDRIKVLGRQVKNYEDDVWNRYRYSIVLEENLAKYSELRSREFIREFSKSIYAGGKLEVIEEYTKELARLRNRKN